MGPRMAVVVVKNAGQSQGFGRMSGDAGAFPVCEVNTLITPDRTTIQVRSSALGQVGIDRSSWKGLNTGRLEKAQVRCSYSLVDCTPWCSTDVMVDVNALRPPHVLKLCLWVIKGMLPVKYFHPTKPLFMSVEFHGHKVEVNLATLCFGVIP